MAHMQWVVYTTAAEVLAAVPLYAGPPLNYPPFLVLALDNRAVVLDCVTMNKIMDGFAVALKRMVKP